jgi:thymidylate synthase
MIKTNALNDFDKGYQYLLSSILDEGDVRDTRAGKCISTFGKEFKIDLKKGFPVLTTKKMFTKGVIYELLWFLQHPQDTENGMNIKYLVDNNVHIWDADAYRWFKVFIQKEIKDKNRIFDFKVRKRDDDGFHFEIWERNDEFKNNFEKLISITKDEFLQFVKDEIVISIYTVYQDGSWKPYQFGDLGKVYGYQWRMWERPIDNNECMYVDQINKVINTLKTNPTDRRMLCTALNVGQMEDMALPPCHVMFQFYARKLTRYERWNEYKNRFGETEKYKTAINVTELAAKRVELDEILDANSIPIYGLSCKYTMRSCDEFLGQPFNILSYALLTHMIAKLVNMIPDTLISSMGDCHIYCAHIDAVKEQLQRKGSPTLPILKIHGEQKTIDDFKYEDFEIIGYNPDPQIKAPLLVGD